MSTVLLMTDSWTPTVLRLVPFSSNNAKHTERKSNGRQNNARGFPVLAVTRGANKVNSASSTEARSAKSASSRSLQSAQSDYHPMDDVESQISAYTTPACATKHEEHVSKHKKYPQKKIPVTHSEMKEAIRFSVQDLNDQISSSSSMPSTEDTDSKEKLQKVDNTRTSLPKPSMSGDPSFAGQWHGPPHAFNGVRRSVPLTPGEMELQRIRDNYIIEQAQKRRKYKLNVNQLPRSTTPINDHDPDKLNMKQVIAFLQTKTSKDGSPKKSAGAERKSEMRRSNVPTRKGSEVSVVSIRQKSADETETSPERAVSDTRYFDIAKRDRLPERVSSETRHVDRPPCDSRYQERVSRDSRQQERATSDTKYVDKTDNTRNINGCVSVLSTKSTPNIRYGQHTSSSSRTGGTLSVRSYGPRSKEARSSRNKPVKEFKLYRFLAVAPDGERQGLATTVTDSVPNVDITTFSYRAAKNHSPDSPRKFLRKRARDSTANLIHRRMVNKNGPPPVVLGYNRENQDAPTIRLPSMGDSPDEDAETCSTTSATYNSGSVNEKVTFTKLPKKDKSISFSDEKPVTKTKADQKAETKHKPESKHKIEPQAESKKDINNETEDENNNSVTGRLLCNFQARTFKTPDFPRVSINGPRQIHVNMPQENKKPYSQEIVRLTLRQEKSTTRVTSYMSDLQTELPAKWAELDRFESLEAQAAPEGSQDWEMNTPRNLVNQLTNNNFIKVRQKLKSSNMST